MSHFDDISVINHVAFGCIAREIYHPSLILEESTIGYHFDTFFDLLIRIYNKWFIIGIDHKVDDFNFEVINYPFPTSNILSQVGYNTFYSQLIRFYRLCNTIKDFLVRVDLIREKSSIRGYNADTLYKYFLKCCNKFPVNIKYGVPDDPETLWMMLFQNHSESSCSFVDNVAIKKMTKLCEIILVDIYKKKRLNIVTFAKMSY